MKLLLDENLSPRLVESVSDLYPGSAHVHALGLGATNDIEIWKHAKIHEFAIVSKDSDFAERSVLEKQPPKIIWLRTGNCSTDQLRDLLRSKYAEIQRFLCEDDETCLVIERRQIRK